MLRIGICDDLADARLVLRSLLERILENRKIQGQFFEFSSGETLLRWYDHHAGELDIIFLDMELHEIDGMETARRLRNADTGLQLVFVTGYADHVFDGYSVGALGYLLKPPKPEQLEAVLDRAQAALYRDLERAYICRSGDTHYRIFKEEGENSTFTTVQRLSTEEAVDEIARLLGGDNITEITRKSALELLESTKKKR